MMVLEPLSPRGRALECLAKDTAGSTDKARSCGVVGISDSVYRRVTFDAYVDDMSWRRGSPC